MLIFLVSVVACSSFYLTFDFVSNGRWSIKSQKEPNLSFVSTIVGELQVGKFRHNNVANNLTDTAYAITHVLSFMPKV